MDIKQAKQQISDTVEAYLEKDDLGLSRIDISEQRPVFLLGAPGIGKTAIVGQVAHELGIGIVSYSMTHHTRQSALGLPFIVHDEFEGYTYDASEYTMSEIVSSIYDYMKETGQRKGILFLDEINCVSETLYPSMLQFLQFKTFGRHRIPEDWVVVCAGNPPEYNKSVHEFDIVTLDRLRKITLTPDYAAWKEYASSNGVHPAILSFLELKKNCFYAVESTPEGKIFVTARGWVDLSKTITLYEHMQKEVDLNVIEQFLQMPEIAEQFAQYYKLFQKYCADYQVDQIIEGNVSDNIYERIAQAEFDESLAVLSLILDNLTSAQQNVLETQKAVERVRDILRSIKEPLIEGASLDETLGTFVRDYQRISSSNADGAIKNFEDMRLFKRVQAMLSSLYQEAQNTNKVSGQEAFDAIHYSYRGLVSDLEQQIKEEEQHLNNAFAFITNAFSTDREMLVFVTELTARKTTANFINQFGSDAYYQNNHRLMFDENSEELKARITEHLNTLDTNTNEPNSGQSTTHKHESEIDKYYHDAQFEYGFSSLCNMTLPNDMQGKRVLDLGCRRGKGAFKMSDKVGEQGRVVGIDWSEDFIKEAKERMERAWKKSGLPENNMEFHCTYPEDLLTVGIGDNSFDMVFINSVINLTYDPQQVMKEVFRVLKPGGTFVCETVLADKPRNEEVRAQAKALGNSIQSAPSREDFEQSVQDIGFTLQQYVAEMPVEPDTGFKFTHKVPTAPSDEQVTFTAQVAELVKPR